MTKKSLIYFILFVLITAGLAYWTFVRNNSGDIMTYIFLMLFISGVFVFLILKEFYIKHMKGFKPQNDILYRNSDSSDRQNLKIISTRPFLFGLEKKFISNDTLYFDEENLYAIDNNQQKAIFPLTTIILLKKVPIEINNRKLWQIKLIYNGEEIEFRFAPNYSIWSDNFKQFYNKIMQINPEVVQTKWNIFAL